MIFFLKRVQKRKETLKVKKTLVKKSPERGQISPLKGLENLLKGFFYEESSEGSGGLFFGEKEE